MYTNANKLMKYNGEYRFAYVDFVNKTTTDIVSLLAFFNNDSKVAIFDRKEDTITITASAKRDTLCEIDAYKEYLFYKEVITCEDYLHPHRGLGAYDKSYDESIIVTGAMQQFTQYWNECKDSEKIDIIEDILNIDWFDAYDFADPDDWFDDVYQRIYADEADKARELEELLQAYSLYRISDIRDYFIDNDIILNCQYSDVEALIDDGCDATQARIIVQYTCENNFVQEPIQFFKELYYVLHNENEC